MIRAVLLLHTLLLCLSLRSDLSLSFPTPSMAKRKSCCTLHYLVTSAAILHFKQTDCFILHDVKTIENELKAGNIKLQPASVLYVDLGQLGWWPYIEHHPKMGFVNYFQAYFLQWIGFVIIIISQSHMRMFILSDCVHLFWRRTKVISTKKFLWLVLNLIIWLFSSILLPP